MKIFLAGCGDASWMTDDFYDFYRLHTFHDINEKESKITHKYKDFLLDSGAFSFLGGKSVDFDKYVDRYIDYINKYKIDKFFELDLYSIIGIKETERLRDKIESGTGKKSIPVFHKILGVDYYKMMCKKYNYISISASGRFQSVWVNQYPEKLQRMVNYANSEGVKVHGLGFTQLKKLRSVKFYSVDSTSWLSGGRFGIASFFNGHTIVNKSAPEGYRAKSKEIMENNFREWIKFQRYCDIKI